MITIKIPGSPALTIEHLVLDFNGTLATDGIIVPGVLEMLDKLSNQVKIHVLTADTFGTSSAQVAGHPFALAIAPEKGQDRFKAEYVRTLGRNRVACIGNGRNDRLMMREAALSMAVIQGEGAATETVTAAHVLCTGILPALSLLEYPKRIVATLRN